MACIILNDISPFLFQGVFVGIFSLDSGTLDFPLIFTERPTFFGVPHIPSISDLGTWQRKAELWLPEHLDVIIYLY